MLNLERANSGKPVRWVSLLGVLLVPIIVAGGFLAALWQAEDRMDNVQAAVVNLDEMAELNGQQVPLGRQLAAGLSERRDDNFTWVLADEQNAQDGLKTGEYAAVITIPEDFSRNALSFGGDAADATSATIDVQTSQITGVADGAIASMIAETARNTLNTELTEQYLDGVYIGFNEMGKQFQTVADASSDLATGSEELSDGVGQARDGADEFATGIDAYATGVGEAASGANELSTGVNQLSQAGGELRSGGTELNTGVQGLASGVGELATGTGQLADQTSQLPEQTDQLANGVRAAADGSDELATGLEQASGQMPALTDGTQQLADGANQLAPGVREYVGGVNQLVDGLEPATDALQNLSEEDIENLQAALLALGEAQDGAQDAADRLEEFTDAPCPQLEDATDEQQALFCEQWKQAQAGLLEPIGDSDQSPVEWAQEIANSEELGEAAETAETLAPQLPELVEQSGQLGQLKEGGNQLVAGSEQLAAGTTELNNNIGTLADGVTGAATGSRELATGLDSAATGTRQLADGMVPLSAGISELDAGVGQLAGGADQLATGVDQYTNGVGQYTEGVDQTATGVSEFATGMNELATGGTELATGAGEMADGMGQLDDGSTQLADGARALSDGLAEGATQVPTYSDSDRESLASAAAQPVRGDDPGAGAIIPAAASTTLLMAMALWLGGLATFLVIQAVPRRTLTSTAPTWQIVARALAPGLLVGAIQAIALTIIGQIVLDLSAAKVTQVFLLLLLGTATFTTLNHALAAWWGGFGRVISVLFVTLTTAGGIISAVPTFLSSLAPLSPLTPLLNALKIVVTDGSGLTGAIGMTIGWLLLGLGASVAAVLRHRQASPAELTRLAAAPS